MHRTTVFATFILVASAVPAHASDTMTLGASYTHFTRDLGQRAVLSSDWKHVAGADTLILGFAAGERDFGSDAQDATRLSGAWARKWNGTVSTRTAASVASDAPVFTRRQFEQDVTFKTTKRTNLTAGVRQSQYFGDVDALALSLGGAYYLDRLVLRYRYTHHDVDGAADGSAHLLSARLADREGRGSTQLWVGASEVLQAFDWSPTALPGDGKSVALRRVQPLGESLALKVGFERAWQDTPTGDYTASTLSVGLRMGF